MDGLTALRDEYRLTLAKIRARREELQRSLSQRHGDEYLDRRKRIARLYEEEGELVYALRVLVRSMEGRAG